MASEAAPPARRNLVHITAVAVQQSLDFRQCEADRETQEAAEGGSVRHLAMSAMGASARGKTRRDRRQMSVWLS